MRVERGKVLKRFESGPRRSAKSWISSCLAFVFCFTAVFPLWSTGTASAAANVAVDETKNYISLKNTDFSSNNPRVGNYANFAYQTETPPTGLTQLGKVIAKDLQYNYGVRTSTAPYSDSQIKSPNNIVGFKDAGNGLVPMRLATNKPESFGSMFNKERVTLSNNRSFSTYFSFKMHGGTQADGIVFVVQTASNEAGASGGGLGYSGVAKSIGVEYDTWYNKGLDNGTPRNDPRAIGTSSGNRASHVALVLDGNVDHDAQPKGAVDGKNIANMDIKKLSLAQTPSEAASDPYKLFHTWIDYDGLTKKFNVYLIRENNNGTYLVPQVGTDGKLVIAGNEVATQEVTQFPYLENGQLVSRTSGGSVIPVKPIMSDTQDLSSMLLQDDAYIGFTAATGGSYQDHDIYSWQFNNYSGLIVPGTNQGQQEVEQAPTHIQIVNTVPLRNASGLPVFFQKDTNGSNGVLGVKPVTGAAGDTPMDGIKAGGSTAEIQAEVRTIDGDLIAGYPVTFSMYYVLANTQVDIGSGRKVWSETLADDSDMYLTADGYEVRTQRYDRNGQEVLVREITVPSDANGVASVNLWNLGDYPHLSYAKARIGGELNGKVYGGGNFDTTPVYFESGSAPVVTNAKVGDDRKTIVTTLDMPVTYDPHDTGGFYIEVPDPADPSATVKIPLVVKGHAKDSQDEDDPFRLVMEIDADSPDYPPSLPADYVIPPNVQTPLNYDKDKGSVTGTGAGGLPLESFPVNGGVTVPVENRFAPVSHEVVNTQDRDSIRITFPDSIEPVAANAMTAFTVTINDGVLPPVKLALTPAGTPFTQDTDKHLTLKLDLNSAPGVPPAWNGKIPLAAEVSISYEPGKLNAADLIKKADGSHEQLDLFLNDPVRNQMQPTAAEVINDESRNKVKVEFAEPLNAASLPGSAPAFSFKLDGIAAPVSAINVEMDPADLTGQTLIFTLDAANLPATGIPFKADDSAPTNITMNYSTGIAGADIKELLPLQRSLGWLEHFDVKNQTSAFEPAAAAVGTDRNTVTVKFERTVDVIGQPELSLTWDNGATVYPVDMIGNGTTDQDTLVLALPNGIEIPENANVQLTYTPKAGDRIIDHLDPSRVLRPLGPVSGVNGDFPVSNVGIAITAPANGSTIQHITLPVQGTYRDAGTPVHDHVVVTVTGATYGPVNGTVTVLPNGEWTFTPDSYWRDDIYTVTATAKDVLGKIVDDTMTFTVVGPRISVIGPMQYGQHIQGPVTVITGMIESSADLIEVEVRDGLGQLIPGQALKLSNDPERWTFIPDEPIAADGTYTVISKGRDANGDEFSSEAYPFTIDTVAPVVTIDSPADGYIGSPNAPVDKIVVSPNEPATSVTVSVYDRNNRVVAQGLAIPGPGDQWTFTPDRPISSVGTYRVEALAMDMAGNLSTVSIRTFTIRSANSGGSDDSGSSGGIGIPIQPQPKPDPEAPKPVPIDLSAVNVNLEISRSIHPDGGQASVKLSYKNLSGSTVHGGQIELILPKGVEVIDAAGGKVIDGKIVWDVDKLDAGQLKSYHIKLKWPQLAQGVDEQAFTLSAQYTASGDHVSGKANTDRLQLLVYGANAGALKHERYILGFPDGDFKPHKSLTRAELAAIIARLLGDYESAADSYKDVPEGHWAYSYIRTVTKHQIFEGYQDGSFHPDQPVSRGELASVMARYLKLDQATSLELHFNDVTAGSWSASAIETLARHGMLQGYSDGTFRPNQAIVRSEAVALINRMLYRGPLVDIDPTWPDVPKSFWAFGDIQEASVSHQSARKERNGEIVEAFKEQLNDLVK